MLVLFTLLVVLIVLAVLPWNDLSRERPSSATSARIDLTPYDVALLPDQVRLARTPLHRFANVTRVRAVGESLGTQGFLRAGNFKLTGWPGLRVRLMVNRTESLIAAIHDHDAAGVWIEITSRYWEGGQVTHTTLASDGLEPRPGHIVLRMPGATIEELLQRARADRSRDHLRRVRRREAAACYEASYASWIAWQKGRLHPNRRRVVSRPLKAA